LTKKRDIKKRIKTGWKKEENTNSVIHMRNTLFFYAHSRPIIYQLTVDGGWRGGQEQFALPDLSLVIHKVIHIIHKKYPQFYGESFLEKEIMFW
jgi:hypothetical protein